MTYGVLADLALIAFVAVLAPILAVASRGLAIPGVVIELALGIVIGPEALHLAEPSPLISDFASMGLALLMFLAGYELDPARLRGRSLVLGAASWAGSLVLAGGVALALFFGGFDHGGLVIALALTTTALGTLLPPLRDAGVLDTSLGRYVLALGSIAEFGPIVLIALTISGDDPLKSILLLAGFAVLAFLCVLAARHTWGRRITDELRRGLHSSSQLPVRVSMLLIVCMVLFARNLGLDVLLGSFAAGVIIRVAVAGQGENQQTALFQGKLEAIGFGFLVPIFFIVSGMRLDLDTFGQHPEALLQIPIFLLLLMVVRGLPTLLTYRRVLPRQQWLALGLLSATGLPLIVVVTAIGTANGALNTQTAAALVAAGVLSVLIFPATGLRMLSIRPATTLGEPL